MPRHQKRQFESLFFVQPWIAISCVIQTQVFFDEAFRAADAFCDCVAGEFEVDAAEEGGVGFVDLEGRGEFLVD